MSLIGWPKNALLVTAYAFSPWLSRKFLHHRIHTGTSIYLHYTGRVAPLAHKPHSRQWLSHSTSSNRISKQDTWNMSAAQKPHYKPCIPANTCFKIPKKQMQSKDNTEGFKYCNKMLSSLNTPALANSLWNCRVCLSLNALMIVVSLRKQMHLQANDQSLKRYWRNCSSHLLLQHPVKQVKQYCVMLLHLPWLNIIQTRQAMLCTLPQCLCSQSEMGSRRLFLTHTHKTEFTFLCMHDMELVFLVISHTFWSV